MAILKNNIFLSLSDLWNDLSHSKGHKSVQRARSCERCSRKVLRCTMPSKERGRKKRRNTSSGRWPILHCQMCSQRGLCSPQEHVTSKLQLKPLTFGLMTAPTLTSHEPTSWQAAAAPKRDPEEPQQIHDARTQGAQTVSKSANCREGCEQSSPSDGQARCQLNGNLGTQCVSKGHHLETNPAGEAGKASGTSMPVSPKRAVVAIERQGEAPKNPLQSTPQLPNSTARRPSKQTC